MQIHLVHNLKCRRRTVVCLTSKWKGGTLIFASPLQRSGAAAVFQGQLFQTKLVISAACIWAALSTSVCSCFCQTPAPFVLACFVTCRSVQSHLHFSGELVSSHFNWLKKCLCSHALPILSQLEGLCSRKQFPEKQMLFLVRSLRFRHPSLQSSFNTSIVQVAGALLMNMSDLTFLKEQTSRLNADLTWQKQAKCSA